MTFHKLSAGSGYEYLTRQVAAADSTELGSTPLANYYSAKGEAPGRWIGAGLVGLEGIEYGDIVTAEQMAHLFGTGSHPITGEALGRRFQVHGNEGVDGFNLEVTRRVAAIDDPTPDQTAKVRTDVAREWFVRRHDRAPRDERELSAALAKYSRPRRTTVAGFDLTFSPVKSVSTLWAVAPPEIAREIEQAHHAAVADAIRFLQSHAIFTREGAGGVRQVETRGLIAAAFTHRDSRAGDPDLHTHVAVANKVQTQEGKWLSIFGSVLHDHIVAGSEAYNSALEARLRDGLGVRFIDRQVASEKRPIREIEGVDRLLCGAWSRRREAITIRQRELTKSFTARHGRTPTPSESAALAQQANLETRQAKHEPSSEAEQQAMWRHEARIVLGSQREVDRMIHTALHPPNRKPRTLTASSLKKAAADVLRELESHQATWQSWHVHAEAQRQVRYLDLPAEYVAEVVDAVVEEAMRGSINLTPEHDPIHEPNALRRSDGTSVYRHSGADHFTTPRILEAEQRIVTAASTERRTHHDPVDVELAIIAAEIEGPRLNDGQRRLVQALASDPHEVTVALAPAGSGKTTAMCALAQAWQDLGGEPIGLAPSAVAAAALGEATGMPTETLAKFDHLVATDQPSSIGASTLVVIDEAGMADTLTLDRVIDHCISQGAIVRLIGDDRQLAAVGAGGVLRDIAITHGAQRLDEVVRFADSAEAQASLDLRAGDAKALGFYLDHDRVHVGDSDTCVDEILDAWIRDQREDRDCLMLAPTRELVSRLNHEARRHRLGDAQPAHEVPLRDGNHASVGETIVTRHNERRLGLSGTDWVRNGDRWTVTASHADGSLTVRHVCKQLHVVLPADYVASHVDLGYATTVHTAQGTTADVMHGIVTGNEDRRLLYTMLTRGRIANHVHVLLDTMPNDDQVLPGITEQLTAVEILREIVSRGGVAVSATTARDKSASPATQLHDAVRRYADSVTQVSRRILGADADHALEAAGPGPLPWLPSIPIDLRRHEAWHSYLTARAQRVADLAAQITEQQDLPPGIGRFADVLTGRLRSDVLLWRAANGVPEEDRRILGARIGDFAADAYARHLQRQVDRLYPASARRWEARIADAVGQLDEHTLDLALELSRLEASGVSAGVILRRALAGSPLPEECATEALAYRVQRYVTRFRSTDPVRLHEPPRQEHGLGL